LDRLVGGSRLDPIYELLKIEVTINPAMPIWDKRQ
jgi:hypothetical protein